MSVLHASDFQPTHALYRCEPRGTGSLELLLAPFEFMGETVRTSVRLDDIRKVGHDLNRAVGKAFRFPVNPKAGYIDGSVYFGSRHHPVDITELAFDRTSDGAIRVQARGALVVVGQPGFDGFAIDLTAPVWLPLSDPEIEALVAEAIHHRSRQFARHRQRDELVEARPALRRAACRGGAGGHAPAVPAVRRVRGCHARSSKAARRRRQNPGAQPQPGPHLP